MKSKNIRIVSLVLLSFLLLSLSGCSQNTNSENKYTISTIYSDNETPVNIISYEGENGSFYYKVLPNLDNIDDSGSSGINGYPYDWMEVTPK